MLYAMFSFFVHGPRLLAFLDNYTPLGGEDKREILEKGVAITRATLKSFLIIGALQGALGGAAFAVVGIQSPVFRGIVMVLTSVDIFTAAFERDLKDGAGSPVLVGLDGVARAGAVQGQFDWARHCRAPNRASPRLSGARGRRTAR